MKRMLKTLFFVGFAAAISHAEDSFGGVGVSFYADRGGVRVAEVIPGTPAAETGLQKGDVIVSIDGASIKGDDSKTVKMKLRGQKNQPVEISYVRDGETYSSVIRRVQITVKDVASVNETNVDADKNLVAVLQNGELAKASAKSTQGRLDGVYVDKPAEKKFTPTSSKNSRKASAQVKSFDRKSVGVVVTSAGDLEISILNADGSHVATLKVDDASVGVNNVAWNSEKVPSGRYMVVVKHNGSVSGEYAVLK